MPWDADPTGGRSGAPGALRRWPRGEARATIVRCRAVVLNSGDFYLVRSADGLVGWVRLKQDGTATQFQDINYAGD
jgi:hypothetical protein